MTILANGGTLTASYVYSGLADYFGGHGCAEGREFLLYAYYGRKTSLADIVDDLVSDCYVGPVGEEFPEDITDDDVREALMDMLTEQGRADVASGALAECSAECGAEAKCSCGASLTDVDDGDPCPVCDDWNEYGESPIFVVVLDYEYPEAPADPAGCPDYDSETGCVECHAYAECDDREETADESV